MAHLKLFFPSISHSTNVLPLFYSHSALTSLLCPNDDQGPELPLLRPQPLPLIRSLRAWNRLRTHSVKVLRERVDNLRAVRNGEASDFWGEGEKDGQFVHALQLLDEDCNLSDVETVRSEFSGSQKYSDCSDTESLEGEHPQQGL